MPTTFISIPAHHKDGLASQEATIISLPSSLSLPGLLSDPVILIPGPRRMQNIQKFRPQGIYTQRQLGALRFVWPRSLCAHGT